MASAPTNFIGFSRERMCAANMSKLGIALVAVLCCSSFLSVGGATRQAVMPSRSMPHETKQIDLADEPSPTAALLQGLDGLVTQTVGNRRGCRISDGLDGMRSELSLLTKESEELQALLIEHTGHERLLTKLTERESKGGDSFVLPLRHAAKIALEEVEGGRRANSAPIHQVQGSASAETHRDPPIFVPHRRGRDDVLALKLLSLLEAGACALNDSMSVLNSAAVLHDFNSSSLMPTEAAKPDSIRAALNEDASGKNEREIGAFASAFVKDSRNRDADAGGEHVHSPIVAPLEALRGGGCNAADEDRSPCSDCSDDHNHDKLSERGSDSKTATLLRERDGRAEGTDQSGLLDHRFRRSQSMERKWERRRLKGLRGGWEVDMNLQEIAQRKKPQVFPFLPDLKIDRRRMVKEMLGVDPAVLSEDEQQPHQGWYDDKDELLTEEEEYGQDSDGTWRLRDQGEAADPARWEAEEAADLEIERKAAEYRARKLPPIESIPEFSEDPRVRLAAQRNFTKHVDDIRNARITHVPQSKRELQRQRQLMDFDVTMSGVKVRILQRDLFRMGYNLPHGRDDYMDKGEAREMLDFRDQEEMYRFYCDEFLPLCLQHPDGPDATMQSLSLLKQVYSDKPRYGGIDPQLLYPGDPYAEMKVWNDERASGEADHPAYPRNFEYPKGDWSTRIIGTNPFMPCINSKVVMRALEAANVTARKLKKQQAAEEEEYRRLVVELGVEEGTDGDAMEDDDTALRRRLLSRWGTIDKAKLNDQLMQLTSWASRLNETRECEVLCDRRGPVEICFPPNPHALGNISLVVEDGADINYHDPKMCGFTPLHLAAGTGSEEVVRALVRMGADLSARSDNGGTPLHYAAFNDKNATVKALLELGAEVDAKNNFEQTPLHLAASFCSNASAIMLLDAGADPAARDAEGQTPADLVADLDFAQAKMQLWLDGLEEDRCWEELLGVLRQREAEKDAMQS